MCDVLSLFVQRLYSKRSLLRRTASYSLMQRSQAMGMSGKITATSCGLLLAVRAVIKWWAQFARHSISSVYFKASIYTGGHFPDVTNIIL